MVKVNNGRVQLSGHPIVVSAEIACLILSYSKASGKRVDDAVLEISNEVLKRYRELSNAN